jgi:voltage-gated potassium channel
MSDAPPASRPAYRPARRVPPAGLLASPGRNLVGGLIYLAVVMAAATVAYVEAGWNLGDALYMVIITVYTVGYGEVRPVDTAVLRAISISTIVLGCTGVIFLTGALIQFITLNQLNQVLGLKRMTSQIDRLAGHVIICGFGRIGSMLARELDAGRADFVILERDEALAEEIRGNGYLCLHGDATDEAALRAAGVLRARTLATVLPNDAANVFITLSARSLNPGLEIIARGEAPSTEGKLLQAGANKVVLPTHIGAERIAEMILYRRTAQVLHDTDRMRGFDQVLRALGLNMDVATAASDSAAAGQTVEALERAAEGAFFVVQINRRQGEPITSPEPHTRIEPGDGVVLIGRVLGSRHMFESATAPRPPGR